LVERADVVALIGVCAVLEGHLMGDSDGMAGVSRGVGRRLFSAGPSSVAADERAVRQAINDLSHRLRYALGEYSNPPVTQPVPE